MFEFVAEEYPKGPGVYLMHDARGRIIYVGKAKSLVKRLSSYFRGMDRHTAKTAAMVSRVAKVQTLSTATEKEALLLEASLIKKHRPHYNIVLRDDKSYILFRLTKKHEFPRLVMTRRVVRDGSTYYGPFTSGLAAKRTWKVLGRAFPLRKCGDRSFANRTRPCLYHHIGQCLAPCVGGVTASDYGELVHRVELFMTGHVGEVLAQLEKVMLGASEALEFERAARFRDQIRAIEATVERQAVVLNRRVDLDALAVAEAGGGLGLGIIYVRQGRMLDARTFHWSDMTMDDAPESVAGFLTQFYWKTRFIPERILLPWPLDDAEELSEALAERRGGPVRLITPRGAEQKRLVEMARANAVQAKPEVETDTDARLARALKLKESPRRIECVDISHLGGGGMRAGLVVFESGSPHKDAYRTYKFPELEGSGDDYAALAAFAARRVASDDPYPDLLLIDGGRGQVATVAEALSRAGAEAAFPIAGIAKSVGDKQRPGPDRRAGALDDRVFLPGRSNPLNIRPGSPELLFLQRIRDEAHRYVIGRQRASRKKSIAAGELESLQGVGPKTARLLWDAFGSLDAMRGATEADLKAVPGLGAKRAAQLHKALQALGPRPS